jgi:N-succinyl-L-ornithine transcarbamylase
VHKKLLHNNKTGLIEMKNFISVHDVDNINALVAKALAYKAAPLSDKNWVPKKELGYYS